MAGGSGDKVSMPSDIQLAASFVDAKLQSNARRTTRSVSMSTAVDAMGPYRSENGLLSFTGPLNGEKREVFIPMSGPLHASQQSKNFGRAVNETLNRRKQSIVETVKETGQTDSPGDDDFAATNEHLLRSGPLGRCNDPFCITCPMYYDFRVAEKKLQNASASEYKFNALYGDAKGWAEKSFTCLKRCIPGIMNPHTKLVQKWNQFFVISCLVAILVDPFLFFSLSVKEDKKCIFINSSVARAVASIKSITDFMYLLHILLQFRLAYAAQEGVLSSVVLVSDPKKIALRYLRRYFLVDILVSLPISEIMALMITSKYSGPQANLLCATVLPQYLLRILRFLPLVAIESAIDLVFESAWANYVINLLAFVLAGHVVGSLWYLFGVQRIEQCLREVCSENYVQACKKFINCGHESNFESAQWKAWKVNMNSGACFDIDQSLFAFGIYEKVVVVSRSRSIIPRYAYSLFWGVQQLSTIAGNLSPTDFIGEVLFTLGVVVLSLSLFALVIGNMQNFFQFLGQRRLEKTRRSRDVEKWMRHLQLPPDLRWKVREAEKFKWASTRVENEGALMESFPEDLQREIRCHLFQFFSKVRFFKLMGPNILDAIRRRLRRQLYIKGSLVLKIGDVIEKMVFIVWGNMESIGDDGSVCRLSVGDVCGEELIPWILEHASLLRGERRTRTWGMLMSKRTVRCLTNMEAYELRADDLGEVAATYARYLRNPRVQAAIRFESPYWRTRAAVSIQMAWRHRKKRLSRIATRNPQLSWKFSSSTST